MLSVVGVVTFITMCISGRNFGRLTVILAKVVTVVVGLVVVGFHTYVSIEMVKILNGK